MLICIIHEGRRDGGELNQVVTLSSGQPLPWARPAGRACGVRYHRGLAGVPTAPHSGQLCSSPSRSFLNPLPGTLTTSPKCHLTWPWPGSCTALLKHVLLVLSSQTCFLLPQVWSQCVSSGSTHRLPESLFLWETQHHSAGSLKPKGSGPHDWQTEF